MKQKRVHTPHFASRIFTDTHLRTFHYHFDFYFGQKVQVLALQPVGQRCAANAIASFVLGNNENENQACSFRVQICIPSARLNLNYSLQLISHCILLFRFSPAERPRGCCSGFCSSVFRFCMLCSLPVCRCKIFNFYDCRYLFTFWPSVRRISSAFAPRV